MVLVLDNYDSFTYNLVQYLGELGAEVRVVRNDAESVEQIASSKPTCIVISPGPGRPEDAGITMEVIRQLGKETPILGVCLGHQAIGAVFGGAVVRAPVPMHGKTSTIEHNGRGVFSGLTAPFLASRYHSLVVSDEHFPDAGRRDHHGTPPSQLAGAWRPVPPRVDSHRRRAPPVAELSRRTVRLTCLPRSSRS
jgi:anthranilate synthase/aminodeoxychorismate synthase-like glutamine amidotransferase